MFLKEIDAIKEIKNFEGADIKIWGSSELVQLLFEHDLIAKLWLNIHPVVLSKGKRMFNEAAISAAFEVLGSKLTSTGVFRVN